MMLRYAEGSASTAERERGFLDAIAAHKEIEVVSANQYGGVTTESAFKASENLLAAHKGPDGALDRAGDLLPQRVDRVRHAARAGGRRLRRQGRASSGSTARRKLIDAMAKGHMDATVVQDPIKMGYLAVKAMVDHLAGQAGRQAHRHRRHADHARRR